MIGIRSVARTGQKLPKYHNLDQILNLGSSVVYPAFQSPSRLNLVCERRVGSRHTLWRQN